MAERNLEGKRVAILVANDFEQVELTKPREALEAAGASTSVVSPIDDVEISGMKVVHGSKGGKVKAVNHDQPGDTFAVDVPLAEANPDDYDALLLPGGAMNPDQLRVMGKALEFVRSFDSAGKPIAVICHGPWTLVSAGLVRGRTITSWPTLQDDIRNAGGNWVNQEVAKDHNWVSSRGPADIEAFNSAMVELIAEGIKPRKEPSAAQAM